MATEIEIRKIQLDNGRVPFDDWYGSLPDKAVQASVAARLARVRAGNFGDHKSVGSGVSELRINVGPGFRVYYGMRRGRLVLLLGGGDKSTQQRDIRRAIQLWEQWKQIDKSETEKL